MKGVASMVVEAIKRYPLLKMDPVKRTQEKKYFGA